jgi:UDP-N-acetylmuramate dehydrogenase
VIPVTARAQSAAGPRLSDMTTFRLGGPARALFECPEPDALVRAIRTCAARGEPFVVLGGGSNILAADRGVDRTVLRFATSEVALRRNGREIEVDGAAPLDGLVDAVLREGLGDLAYAAGIPGTVGGGIAGNAGAFGRQLGEDLIEVDLALPSGTVETRRAAELGFSYRASRIGALGATVLRARFFLRPADPAAARDEARTIRDLRRAKHPDWTREPCAGSVFRNVEPSSRAARRRAAGWFLERVGALGWREGGAAVYAKHANIIVKKSPDCTARDVYRLSERMREAVRREFGIELTREIRLLGSFEEKENA